MQRSDGGFYVQSIAIKMLNADGKLVTRSFIGLAFTGPGDWEEIAKENLGQRIKGIGMETPVPIDKLLADNPDNESLHNVVDLIRREAQKFDSELRRAGNGSKEDNR